MTVNNIEGVHKYLYSETLNKYTEFSEFCLFEHYEGVFGASDNFYHCSEIRVG